MTPAHIKAIRKQAGLSQTGLAAVLRIADQRTIRRWESGDIPISGPASIILDMIDRGDLPNRFLDTHNKPGQSHPTPKPDIPTNPAQDRQG